MDARRPLGDGVQIHLVTRIVLQDIVTDHATAEGKLAKQQTIAVVMHVIVLDGDAVVPLSASMPLKSAPLALRAGIGDFQILYFPIGLVQQIDRARCGAIRSFDPLPYRPTTMGRPSAPEPLGFNWPAQDPPDFSKMLSPGWQTAALTLARFFQAMASEVPARASPPEVASS